MLYTTYGSYVYGTLLINIDIENRNVFLDNLSYSMILDIEDIYKEMEREYNRAEDIVQSSQLRFVRNNIK